MIEGTSAIDSPELLAESTESEANAEARRLNLNPDATKYFVEVHVAGLELIRLGYEVAAVKPFEKNPCLTPNGFNGATSDASTFLAWHRKYPLMGLGISTKGLAVVDADVSTKNGIKGVGDQTLRELSIPAWDTSVISPMREITWSLGSHDFFRTTDELEAIPAMSGGKRKTNALGPFLDLLYGAGGVFCAPTRIHADGIGLEDPKPCPDGYECKNKLTCKYTRAYTWQNPFIAKAELPLLPQLYVERKKEEAIRQSPLARIDKIGKPETVHSPGTLSGDKMSSVLELLKAFTGKDVRGSNGQYKTLCPACKDSSPSLSITETSGKILLNCFAGCSKEKICAALDITMSDLYKQPRQDQTDNNDDKSKARPRVVQLIKADTVTPAERTYAIYPYIPNSEATWIEGSPRCGKTMAAMSIIATVTNGGSFVNGESVEPANVAILSSEDSIEYELQPRLIVAGATLSRVSFITVTVDNEEQPITFLDDLPAIEQRLREEKIGLVFVDGVFAFLGVKDGNSYTEAYSKMLPLIAMVRRLNIALLIVRHTRKSGGEALHTGVGSTGYTALARSTLSVAVNKNDKEERLFTHAGTTGAPTGDSYTFRIEGKTLPGFMRSTGVAVWGDKTDVTADEAMAQEAPPTTEERSALDEAKEAILEALAGDPVTAPTLQACIIGHGVAYKTFARARSKLKKDGKIERVGGGTAGPVMWQKSSPKSIVGQENHCWPPADGGPTMENLANNDQERPTSLSLLDSPEDGGTSNQQASESNQASHSNSDQATVEEGGQASESDPGEDDIPW